MVTAVSVLTSSVTLDNGFLDWAIGNHLSFLVTVSVVCFHGSKNSLITEQLNNGTINPGSVKGSDEMRFNRIADNLLFTFQSFRRMSKGDGHHGVRRFEPSRLVLATVLMEGPLPTSEIGKRMDISKSYMTTLIDKLIEEGLVERISDKNDRRVVNVAATKAGRDILKEFRSNARKIIMENLSSLTSDDISALDVSLKTIRSITSKLNRNETKKCERG